MSLSYPLIPPSRLQAVWLAMRPQFLAPAPEITGRQSVRTALLEAANFIERNPRRYNFLRSRTPREEDDLDGAGAGAGCVIGWTARKYGVADGQYVADICPALFGQQEHDLYKTLDAMQCRVGNFINWRTNAKSAATVMRAYADRFHPEVA